MAGFGSVGSPYPMRFDAPQSETVGFVGDYDAWNTDWQSRYNAEAAKAGQGARAAGPSKAQYVADQLKGFTGGNNVSWGGQSDVNAAVNHFAGNGQFHYGDQATGQQVLQQTLGSSLYNRLANYQPQAARAGYVPNFGALNAEKAEMTPKFQAQQRNQSAYDSMTGFGQQNGIIGEDYSAPGFGQVTGTLGNPYQQGQNGDLTGVNMGFTSGAYAPSQGNTGVYGGVGRTNRGWGL